MNIDERLARLRAVVGVQGDKVQDANARSHESAELARAARQAAQAQLQAVRRTRIRSE